MSSILRMCVLSFVFLMTLASCGGDEQVAEGGIGGTGISSGPINGFGSIIVNGIRFDVSQAQILMGGVESTEGDLRHGMVVAVYGDIDESNNTGVATKVVYNTSVRGQIESIDEGSQQFVIMGQRVSVDDLTVFDGLNVEAITQGMNISVSGISNADNDLLASYISSLATKTDESGAVADVDGELGSPISNAPAIDSETLAEPELATPGNKISLNGLITAETSSNRFNIRGVVVEVNEETVYQNGDVHSIVLNGNVLVTGNVSNDGVVIATEVKFRSAQLVRVAAQVDAVSQSAVTLAGRINAEVSTSTLMLDSSAAALRAFSLQAVSVGDHLIVYGYQSSDGVVLARLERVDSLEQQSISGPVASVSGQPVFDVLGVTVDTSLMSANADLFVQLTVDDWVDVAGDLNGSVLAADNVVIRQ